MTWDLPFVEAQRGLAALLAMDRRLQDLGIVEHAPAAAAAEHSLGVDHLPELNGRERLHREQDLADPRAPSLEVGGQLPPDRFRELLFGDEPDLDRDAAEEAAD